LNDIDTKNLSDSEIRQFQTSGKATGSFLGRFGGLADPHPEGVKSGWSYFEESTDVDDSVSEKVKSKSLDKTAMESVTSSPLSPEEELLADAWIKDVSSEKKGEKVDSPKKIKLTREEKEIEART